MKRTKKENNWKTAEQRKGTEWKEGNHGGKKEYFNSISSSQAVLLALSSLDQDSILIFLSRTIETKKKTETNDL